MEEPLVSVILPTYNRANLLTRAVQSVLDQSYKDLELIIVDDGSDDETNAVVRSFEDQRLRYVHHSDNQGVATARNTGLSKSQGALIAFQDSDDTWVREKLELQVNGLLSSDNQVGVHYSPFIRIKGLMETQYPLDVGKYQGNLSRELLYRNLITSSAALVKSECFDKVGTFDNTLDCLVDWDMWIRIAEHYHFRAIQKPLVHVYFTPNGLTANRELLALNLERVLDKHNAAFIMAPKARAFHICALGNLLCLSGELILGRKYLIQSLKIYPGSLRCALIVLASYMGLKGYRFLYSAKTWMNPDWY